MDILLTIITPLLVAFLAFVLFALAKKERNKKNEQLNRCAFVIRSSYSWGVIMAGICVFLLLLLIIGNISEPFKIGVNVALFCLLLLFGYGALQIFRERVEIKGNDIYVTPTIGKRKKYTFEQIDSIESKRTGVYVFIDGKKAFTLDPAGIGTPLFVEIYKTRN